MNAQSRECIKVPCNDEAITTACIEDTLWRGATDKLGSGIEIEGRDAETVTRGIALVSRKVDLGMLDGFGY